MIKGNLGLNGKAMPFPDQLKVGRHDSGGVAIGLGGTVTVISPHDAARFAAAILKAAGIDLEVVQGGPVLIRPTMPLAS